jgi:phospholipase/carboxylesterase
MAFSTFEIEASEPQRGSIIWLHGLGASHRDFLPVIPELAAPYLRFIFPTAPVRALTLSHGMRLPAWYDILSLAGGLPKEDEAHLRESALEIEQLMAREHERGVAHEHIVLAGFSQGGAMALHSGLRADLALGGVMVLSGYLLLPDHFEAERTAASRQTPFLFCHGRFDGVVPHFLGRSGFERVKAAGHTAEWHEYDMEHSMCLEEVLQIRDWLKARFA